MNRLRFKRPEKKIVLIIIDGLGDKASIKTPLEEARTPNLDFFAKNGKCGMQYFDLGVTPGSATSHWQIFGYNMDEFPGRGVLEAIGHGINLKEGNVVFRTNFATVDHKFVVRDRRAGYNPFNLDKIAKEIEKILPPETKFFKTINHRGILIFEKGEIVDDTDPYENGKKVNFLKEDNETAKRVNYILKEVYKLLWDHPLNKEREEKGIPPANIILTRSAGVYRKIEPFEKRFGLKGLGIADYDLYLGIPKYLGMDIRRVGDDQKINILLKEWENYDFFFIHFKLSDHYGEYGMFWEKTKYIEYVDKLLEPLKGREDFVLLITGDHSTPVDYKAHSGDPVPFLVYNPPYRGDGVEFFSEYECYKGFYGTISSKHLIYILLNEAKAILPIKEWGSI